MRKTFKVGIGLGGGLLIIAILIVVSLRNPTPTGPRTDSPEMVGIWRGRIGIWGQGDVELRPDESSTISFHQADKEVKIEGRWEVHSMAQFNEKPRLIVRFNSGTDPSLGTVTTWGIVRTEADKLVLETPDGNEVYERVSNTEKQ